MDAGAVTLEAFGTHLRAYLRLFQALPKLEFIYLAPTARLFQAAESEFYHLLYGARDRTKSVSVLDYFRLRKAWEAKERVASADVVLLKEAQARYAARQFEELYEKWRRGALADNEVTQSSEQGSAIREKRFSNHGMRLIATRCLPTRAEMARKTVQENDNWDGLSQISSNRSIEISGA